jgi:hypothetical protein
MGHNTTAAIVECLKNADVQVKAGLAVLADDQREKLTLAETASLMDGLQALRCHAENALYWSHAHYSALARQEQRGASV